MKKIFLSLFLIAAISPAFAQTVKYGISGGLNESILSSKSVTGEDDVRLTGFHAGIFGDIDFGKVSIEPGLFYTTKGQRVNETLIDVPYYTTQGSSYGSGSASIKVHDNTVYNYLELPVNVLYNMPVKYGKFFIGGGPYLAYCLSAKLKTETTPNDNTQVTEQDTPLTFGGDNGLRRFDFGLGALFGLALKNGLSFNVGFEHGLTNVYKPDTGTAENNVYTLSLGYSFL
ncbi:porin family protein [Mucilaginibacter sp. L196]|uniref:porin family protein n=1 Tax=Mucilaginibacter sp. L196 TaxID=1641870 RepID=UPI00131E6FE9|nr:porin family protein [Mucilaginibacter sp. L196]